MSPLAYVLYALSFTIIGGCAVAVARYGARRFVGWRQETNAVEPATDTAIDQAIAAKLEWAQPSRYGTNPHPIYSELAAAHPEVRQILERARRRQMFVHLDVNTDAFEKGMRSLAAAVRDMKLSTEGIRRLNKEAAAMRRRSATIGHEVGDQLYGAGKKPRRRS